MWLEFAVADKQEMQSVPIWADAEETITALSLPHSGEQLLRVVQILQARAKECLRSLRIALESGKFQWCDSSVIGFDAHGVMLIAGQRRVQSRRAKGDRKTTGHSPGVGWHDLFGSGFISGRTSI